MDQIGVAIHGVSGRMGREVLNAITAPETHPTLRLGVEVPAASSAE